MSWYTNSTPKHFSRRGVSGGTHQKQAHPYQKPNINIKHVNLETASKRHLKYRNSSSKHSNINVHSSSRKGSRRTHRNKSHAVTRKKIVKKLNNYDRLIRYLDCRRHYHRSHTDSFSHAAHCRHRYEKSIPRNFIYQSPGSRDQLIVTVEAQNSGRSESKEDDLLKESKALIHKMINENDKKAIHQILDQFMQDNGKRILKNAMSLMQDDEKVVKSNISMASFKSAIGKDRIFDKKMLVENKRKLLRRIISKTEALLKTKDDKLLKEAIYLINSVQSVIQRIMDMSNQEENLSIKSMVNDKKKLIKTIIAKTQRLIKDKNDNILKEALGLVHDVLSKIYPEQLTVPIVGNNIHSKKAANKSHLGEASSSKVVKIFDNATKKIEDRKNFTTRFNGSEKNTSSNASDSKLTSLDGSKRESSHGIQNNVSNHNLDFEKSKKNANPPNSSSIENDKMMQGFLLEFNKFAETVDKYEKKLMKSNVYKIGEKNKSDSMEDDQIIQDFLMIKKHPTKEQTKNILPHIDVSLGENSSQKPEININFSNKSFDELGDYIINEIDTSPKSIHANIIPDSATKIGETRNPGKKEVEKEKNSNEESYVNQPKTDQAVIRRKKNDGKLEKVNLKTEVALEEPLNLDLIKKIIDVRTDEIATTKVNTKNKRERSTTLKYVDKKPCRSKRNQKKTCYKSRLHRRTEDFSSLKGGSGYKDTDEPKKKKMIRLQKKLSKKRVHSERDMTTFTIRKPKNMSLSIEMNPSDAIIRIKNTASKRIHVNRLPKQNKISPSDSNKHLISSVNMTKTEKDIANENFENDASEVMDELVSLVRDTASESEDLINNLKSDVAKDASSYNESMIQIGNSTNISNTSSSTNVTNSENGKNVSVRFQHLNIAKAYPFQEGNTEINSKNSSSRKMKETDVRDASQNSSKTHVFSDTKNEGDDITSDPQIEIGIRMLQESNCDIIGSGSDVDSKRDENVVVSPHKKTIILKVALDGQREMNTRKENNYPQQNDGALSSRGNVLESEDEDYTTLYPLQYDNSTASVPVVYTETEEEGSKDEKDHNSMSKSFDRYSTNNIENIYGNEDQNTKKQNGKDYSYPEMYDKADDEVLLENGGSRSRKIKEEKDHHSTFMKRKNKSSKSEKIGGNENVKYDKNHLPKTNRFQNSKPRDSGPNQYDESKKKSKENKENYNKSDNKLNVKHSNPKNNVFVNEYSYEGIDTDELIKRLANQSHGTVLSNPIFHKKISEDKNVHENNILGVIGIKKSKSKKSAQDGYGHERKFENKSKLKHYNKGTRTDDNQESKIVSDEVKMNSKQSDKPINLLDELFSELKQDNIPIKDKFNEDLLMSHIKELLKLRKELNATLSKVLPTIENRGSQKNGNGLKYDKKHIKKVSPKFMKHNNGIQKSFNNISVHMSNILLQEEIGKNATEQILKKHVNREKVNGNLEQEANDLENAIILQMVNKKLDRVSGIQLKRIPSNLKEIGDYKSDDDKGSIVETKNDEITGDSSKIANNQIDRHAALLVEVKNDLERKIDQMIDKNENKEIETSQTKINAANNANEKHSEEKESPQVMNKAASVLNQPPNEMLTQHVHAFNEINKKINATLSDNVVNNPPVSHPENTGNFVQPQEIVEIIEPKLKTKEDFLAEHIKDFNEMDKLVNETIKSIPSRISSPESNTVAQQVIEPNAENDDLQNNAQQKTNHEILVDHMHAFKEMGKQINSTLAEINLNKTHHEVKASDNKKEGETLRIPGEDIEGLSDKDRLAKHVEALKQMNVSLSELDKNNAKQNTTGDLDIKNALSVDPVNFEKQDQIRDERNMVSAFTQMDNMINNTVDEMIRADADGSSTMFVKPQNESTDLYKIQKFQQLDKAKITDSELLREEVNSKLNEQKIDLERLNKKLERMSQVTPSFNESNNNNIKLGTNADRLKTTITFDKNTEGTNKLLSPKISDENKKEYQKEISKNNGKQNNDGNVEQQLKVKEALTKMVAQQHEVKQLLTEMLNKTEDQKPDKIRGEELLLKMIEETQKEKSPQTIEPDHMFHNLVNDKSDQTEIIKSKKGSVIKKEKKTGSHGDEKIVKHSENSHKKRLKDAYSKLLGGSQVSSPKKKSRHVGKKENPEEDSESGSARQDDMNPSLDRVVELLTHHVDSGGTLSKSIKELVSLMPSVDQHTEDTASGDNGSEIIQLMGGLTDELNHQSRTNSVSKGNQKQKINKMKKKKETFFPKESKLNQLDTQGFDLGVPDDVAESIHHFYNVQNSRIKHVPKVESPELTTQNLNSTHLIRFLDFSKLLNGDKNQIYGDNKKMQKYVDSYMKLNDLNSSIPDQLGDVDAKPDPQAPKSNTLESYSEPNILPSSKTVNTYLPLLPSTSSSLSQQHRKIKPNSSQEIQTTGEMDIEKMYDTLIDKISRGENIKNKLDNNLDIVVNNEKTPSIENGAMDIILSAYRDIRTKKHSDQDMLVKDVLDPHKGDLDILLSAFKDSKQKLQTVDKNMNNSRLDSKTSDPPVDIERSIKQMINSELHNIVHDVGNSKQLDIAFDNAMSTNNDINYNMTAKRSAAIRPVKGRQKYTNKTDPYATISDSLYVPLK